MHLYQYGYIRVSTDRYAYLQLVHLVTNNTILLQQYKTIIGKTSFQFQYSTSETTKTKTTTQEKRMKNKKKIKIKAIKYKSETKHIGTSYLHIAKPHTIRVR